MPGPCRFGRSRAEEENVERMCVVCQDNPAAFRCIQCHKPVCDACAFKDENGAFCTRECAAKYRSFRQAQAGTGRRKRSSGLSTLIIVLVALAAAAAGAWKLGLLPSSLTDRLPGGAQQQQQQQPPAPE